MIEGETMAEGEDVAGAGVDMETIKRMVDIQIGTEVVGVFGIGGIVVLGMKVAMGMQGVMGMTETMGTKGVTSTTEATATKGVMSTTEAMGTKGVMGTTEAMGTTEEMGMIEVMGTIEVVATEEAIGTEEVVLGIKGGVRTMKQMLAMKEGMGIMKEVLGMKEVLAMSSREAGLVMVEEVVMAVVEGVWVAMEGVVPISSTKMLYVYVLELCLCSSRGFQRSFVLFFAVV